MKKLYYVILAIVLISVCVLSYYFFYEHRQNEKINTNVQSRLEDIMLNHDRFRFELIIRTGCSENNVINGAVDNSVYPENIALNTLEYYTVTVFSNEKKAKIEHKKTEYNFKNTSVNHADTYTDQISYITIQKDEVRVYCPEKGKYAVRSYNKTGLADAVSDVLFPTDISNYYNNKPVQVITNKDVLPHYAVLRDVPIDILYRPFSILRGESNSDKMYVPLSMNFALNDQTVRSDIFQYAIFIYDISGIYAYAYEACTGKVYENDLGRSGYKFRQQANIYFYNNCNEVEAFNLPA